MTAARHSAAAYWRGWALSVGCDAAWTGGGRSFAWAGEGACRPSKVRSACPIRGLVFRAPNRPSSQAPPKYKAALKVTALSGYARTATSVTLFIERGNARAWGVGTSTIGGLSAAVPALLDHAVGEASVHVQGRKP
jgi:hypothetical protein